MQASCTFYGIISFYAAACFKLHSQKYRVGLIGFEPRGDPMTVNTPGGGLFPDFCTESVGPHELR